MPGTWLQGLQGTWLPEGRNAWGSSALCGATTLLAIALALWYRSRARLARLRLPPGKLDYPIGGLQLFANGGTAFLKLCSFHDAPVRKVRIITENTVLVRQLDHIKTLLGADGELTEVSWGRSLRVLLGSQSITFSTGAYHRTLRKLLGPCFAPQAVESYLPSIQAVCERYCASWAEATVAAQAAASGSVPAQTTGPPAPAASGDVAARSLELLPKMQDEVRRLTFEVIATVVAGFDFTPQQLTALSGAFDTFVNGLFNPVSVPLPFTRYGRALAARKAILKMVDQQIDLLEAQVSAKAKGAGTGPPALAANGSGAAGHDTAASGSPPTHYGAPDGSAAEAAANGATNAATGGVAADGGAGQRGLRPGAAATACEGADGGGSVIERLLAMKDDSGKPLSRASLQDNVINLFFAGHETSATTLLRLLLLLREHPAAVERLEEEQRRAQQQHGTAITGAALRSMPYLDAVVKEAWRLYPLVAFVPRRAKRGLTLSGYDVPQGWNMLVGISEPIREHPAWAHLPPGDPCDPRVFNPDRWLDERGEAAGPIGLLTGHMLVFGAGQRYCLGANLAWAEIKVFLAVLARGYRLRCPLQQVEVKQFPAIHITQRFPVQVTQRCPGGAGALAEPQGGDAGAEAAAA